VDRQAAYDQKAAHLASLFVKNSAKRGRASGRSGRGAGI
jgi:hypothetical protein